MAFPFRAFSSSGRRAAASRATPAGVVSPRVLACGIAAVAWAVLAPLAQAQSLIRDTEIEAILHAEADPVLEASGLNPHDIHLVMVNDSSLNAFATQGQVIGVNTGLIMETDTPNQLLGVIAHEAGHVSGGHAIRNDLQHAGMAPFILTAGLGVIAALAGAPTAGAALLGSSTMFGTLGALGYSRTQEGAADQAAVTALEKAGRSGEGLVQFFDKFRYQEVFSDDRRFPFFRSHPLSSERIEALRTRVEAQPHHGVTDSPESIAAHRLIKAKLRAFIDAPSLTLRLYPDTDTSFEARYARAIAWYKASEIDTALRQIDDLLSEHPDNPYLWELKGQVLFEAGRPVDAVPAHRRSVELKPDGPLLLVNYAQALIATNDPANVRTALVQLDRANVLEGDNPLSWKLVADAYGILGDEANALLAAAEYRFASGDNDQARVFALRARDRLQAGTPAYIRAVDIARQGGVTDDDFQIIDRRRRDNPGVSVPGASPPTPVPTPAGS